MLIDISYFVGDLDIPNTDRTEVRERVNWFIDKYEPIFLETLFGYQFYKSFASGIFVFPMDVIWDSILFGAEFQEIRNTDYPFYSWIHDAQLRRWKGLIHIPSGTGSLAISNGGSYYIVVDRGQTYDPADNTVTTIIPPQYVGKPFTFHQRGLGQLRYGSTNLSDDEYTILADVITLTGGHKFSHDDTYFYNYPFASGVTSLSAAGNQSPIANFVYYWYMRDRQTQTLGIGEGKQKGVNSERADAVYKMNRAWNEMCDQVRVLMNYLYSNNLLYIDWTRSQLRRTLNEFTPINTLNI